MAIYAIGDLHLSLAAGKPMDVFEGWENYTQRIVDNWSSIVKPEDTVVLVGDISWGMDMKEAMPDFKLIEDLPGEKIILKGNHDYWWGSVTSMHKAFEENNITTIKFLHNNSYIVEGIGLCGSRGWMFESGQEHDAKIVRREAMRIEASLSSVKEDVERIMFLHYPPVYSNQELPEFIEVMQKYNVKRCYYGHIHAAGHKFAVNGEKYGIMFKMLSADYVDFTPIKIN